VQAGRQVGCEDAGGYIKGPYTATITLYCTHEGKEKKKKQLSNNKKERQQVERRL